MSDPLRARTTEERKAFLAGYTMAINTIDNDGMFAARKFLADAMADEAKGLSDKSLTE